jgi:hypothetical protein
MASTALFQLASDGFWGEAFSGVIKSDGSWCPCAFHPAGQSDWHDYMDWYAQGNKADPWLSPADGGYLIVLKPGEIAVGSMFDSLPPGYHNPPPTVLEATSPPAPASTPKAEAKPAEHASTAHASTTHTPSRSQERK